MEDGRILESRSEIKLVALTFKPFGIVIITLKQEARPRKRFHRGNFPSMTTLCSDSPVYNPTVL